MGVCDSNGIIFDFGGAVNVDNFMFGRPMRFLQLDPRCASTAGGTDEEAAENWDFHVDQSCVCYETKMHCMIFGSDCHSHVACALNLMQYGGCSCWNKVLTPALALALAHLGQ